MPQRALHGDLGTWRPGGLAGARLSAHPPWLFPATVTTPLALSWAWVASGQVPALRKAGGVTLPLGPDSGRSGGRRRQGRGTLRDSGPGLPVAGPGPTPPPQRPETVKIALCQGRGLLGREGPGPQNSTGKRPPGACGGPTAACPTWRLRWAPAAGRETAGPPGPEDAPKLLPCRPVGGRTLSPRQGPFARSVSKPRAQS